MNSNQLSTVPDSQKLSYDRYEAVLELYQAQNAVQIARSVGADRFAPDVLSKAEGLLNEAQSMEARKQDTHLIVSRAREAAQTAEDARMIAIKKRDENRQQQPPQNQNNAGAQVDQDTRDAQSRAEAERAAAEQDRIAAEQARAEAAKALADTGLDQSPAPPPAPAAATPASDLSASQRRTRADLLTALNTVLPTRDTPRGLVVVVPDILLQTSPQSPAPTAGKQLSQIAALIQKYPDMRVRIEGFTDDRGTDVQERSLSEQRAQIVRDILVTDGMPASITAAGYGKEHPIASNDYAIGREQNRRVEIVIAGPAIGEEQRVQSGVYSPASRP